MRRNIIYIAFAALTATVMLVSCASDNDSENIAENGQNVVKATASVGSTTRVSYLSDGDNAGVTAAWESGDELRTLETESNVVTACTFTTTGTGTTAEFTSTNATKPSSSTSWKALYGVAATVNETAKTITCGYDAQDGTLANLKKYDYMIASGTGTEPTLNFSTGTRLSYFIRLKLPTDIKAIEVNTCGSWIVTSTANTAPTVSTDNVTEVELASKTTSAGQIAYIAVPAIDYSVKGLIITIFNDTKAAANLSQGKVLSANLSAKGGKITTLDMSNLTLMARPTSSVDMGTAGKWAEFNIGASTSTENGNYYQWGRTEQSYDTSNSLSYSWDNYFCIESNCGTDTDPIYSAGLITKSENWAGSICATKFDVARVKWGKGWRMPTLDEMNTLATTSEVGIVYISSTSGGISGFNFKSSVNSNTVFLPVAGFCLSPSNPRYVGSYGDYWSGIISSSSTAKYFDNGVAAGHKVKDCDRYFGFSVRPVSEN